MKKTAWLGIVVAGIGAGAFNGACSGSVTDIEAVPGTGAAGGISDGGGGTAGAGAGGGPAGSAGAAGLGAGGAGGKAGGAGMGGTAGTAGAAGAAATGGSAATSGSAGGLPDAGPCAGPNPQGCFASGVCPVGKVCAPVGCAPSSCLCDKGQWACTPDCSGGTCVWPTDAGDAGKPCASTSMCAPSEWCDIEPAPPMICASGGKMGTCKPRPKPWECPDYAVCPGACGCNGTWYCDACEAHVYGIPVTAGNSWCLDAGLDAAKDAPPDVGPDASKPCGGKTGLPCAGNEWCDFPTTAVCGANDALGVCRPRPSACPTTCPGVCGCDAKFYCNDCIAHASGFDVAADKLCMADAGADAGGISYSAYAWPGGLDRIGIFKADAKRNTCQRLILVWPMANSSGISLPSGWGVQEASMTNNAADCSGLGPVVGQTVGAGITSGAVVFQMQDAGHFPCAVDVHVKYQFSAGPVWLFPIETMDADGVLVKGGCM